MQTLYFKEKIGGQGTITLTELPPNREAQIVVLCPEPNDIDAEFNQWLTDLRGRQPFAKMSKADVLAKLRQTRE